MYSLKWREFVQHLHWIGFFDAFLLFKKGQQFGLCTWLCAAIVYHVDLTITGASLCHSSGNECEDADLWSIKERLTLQNPTFGRVPLFDGGSSRLPLQSSVRRACRKLNGTCRGVGFYVGVQYYVLQSLNDCGNALKRVGRCSWVFR